MRESRIDNDLLIAPGYAGRDTDERCKDEGNLQFSCFLRRMDITDQKGLASRRLDLAIATIERSGSVPRAERQGDVTNILSNGDPMGASRRIGQSQSAARLIVFFTCVLCDRVELIT